jgi:hypothetical protein
MTPHEAEIKIALLIEGHKALQAQLERSEEIADEKIAAVNVKLNALQSERDSQMKWGVITLGSAVISMVVWIGNKIIGGQIH